MRYNTINLYTKGQPHLIIFYSLVLKAKKRIEN